MNIRKTEELIGQLFNKPSSPLNEAQKRLAFEYAVGLFVGRLGDLRAESNLTMLQVQGMHALSQKQTFYMEYFAQDEAGRADAKQLGTDADDETALADILLDIEHIETKIPSDECKQIAERSGDWARQKLVDRLAEDASRDSDHASPPRLTVNYDPEKILAKAEAVHAYRQFYARALEEVMREPDTLLAEAKRALVHVYVGRLNTMAAVDVYPGLLSLEEQLARSPENAATTELLQRLVRDAPAIGRIHELEGEDRAIARETYARHLDAIRQGAPFELDEVDETQAGIFAHRALQELAESIRTLVPKTSHTELTDLAKQLQGVSWDAQQIKEFIEAVLSEWGMLSDQRVTWQEVDDRDGFAPDEKFQVIVTPRRKNLSVDSTRRIVNIPEGTVRPLAGVYPAGALPSVAHELSHVLQGYADYELGQQIPLAQIKGRRYRILREAGGAYQEKILSRDYFGNGRETNPHYLQAYIAKAEGRNRLEVARVFYESTTASKQLSPEEDMAARTLAVNRTARLYRYGGQNSQVLDYVEQSVVCDVLMQRMTPEQVDAFLLGSTSFSLEDSVLLHRFGLLTLPTKAAFSPAHDVMRIFIEKYLPELG
jgi:hypothetical protein